MKGDGQNQEFVDQIQEEIVAPDVRQFMT